MGRLGLAGRLVVIVALSLLAMLLMSLAIQLSRDDGAAFATPRSAFAREITALVGYFDTLPPAERSPALGAVNTGRFSVAIVETPPAPVRSGLLLGGVARAVERGFLRGALADRQVVADYPKIDPGDPAGGPLSRLTGRYLRLVVPLRSGGYLVVNPNNDVDAFVLGNIFGFLTGLVGLIVAGLAIYAVFRETRPLVAVAGNVERFAATAEPRRMPETGARELRTLIRATNDMQERIAALMQSRALVLAGVAHDLRTQVTRLRLRMELLPESPAREKAVADIEAMQALIEDSLEFAGESGTGDRGPADLAALAQSVAGERRERGEAVSFAGAVPGPLVPVGATALRRLLDNLLDNALRYGGEAEITVAAREMATLTVDDRGPGIPEELRGKVFDPFFRIEGSRSRAYGGSGLGLAIVKQIVDHHGGEVAVGERPGGGARLTIRLPRAAA